MERLVNNQFQFQVYHTHTHTTAHGRRHERAFFPRDKQKCERCMAERGKTAKISFCCFIYQAFLYLVAVMLMYSLSTAFEASCVSARTRQTHFKRAQEKSINIDVLSAILFLCSGFRSRSVALVFLSACCFCYIDVLSVLLALLLFNHVSWIMNL